MGMLDDIFGQDDTREREEMQENIDKIREKVQGGREPAPAAEREQTPEPPVTPDQIRDERGGGGPQRQEEAPREQTRDRPGTPPEELPPAEPAAAEQDRGPAAERDEEPSDGPTHDDVPEPPEVRDIDVPDIEKGPLFITVDKFRDALEAIADLRRVADEMEDYIGSMEGTLQEDRETEDGVRRILDEAETDTDELKDIVSP
ncbi:MAG: hypothetical protein SVW02_00085 [Candidatus Nanohaloarchaea archaeon]|nr:hypothetical protein [Candidatus Nanohaloarchaea archaeon]